MAFSYNRLWRLLVDRGMARTEMRRAVGMSPTALARLPRGEDVNKYILVRICGAPGRGIHGIVEYTP